MRNLSFSWYSKADHVCSIWIIFVVVLCCSMNLCLREGIFEWFSFHGVHGQQLRKVNRFEWIFLFCCFRCTLKLYSRCGHWMSREHRGKNEKLINLVHIVTKKRNTSEQQQQLKGNNERKMHQALNIFCTIRKTCCEKFHSCVDRFMLICFFLFFFSRFKRLKLFQFFLFLLKWQTKLNNHFPWFLQAKR